MLAYEVNVTDHASAQVARLHSAVAAGWIEKKAGHGALLRIQAHLFAYNAAHPNKLGGARTDFYSQAAKGAHVTTAPGVATVHVEQVGIRQRLEGGEISAPPGGLLTIPATAEAHGKKASEFNNLRFAAFHGPKTVGALVETKATRVRFGRQKKDGTRTVFKDSTSTGLKVFFWLARSVNQVGDPEVMPTKDEVRTAAMDEITIYIDRVLAGGGTDAR